MSAPTLSEFSELSSRLTAARREIRLHTGLQGLLTVMAVVPALILAACLADWLLVLPSYVRLGMLVTIAGATLFLIFRCLVRPLTTELPESEVGAAVDLSAPELMESVTTLLSIESPDTGSAEAGSAVMRRHLREQVGQRLSDAGNTSESVVDHRRTWRCSGLAAAGVMAVLLPLFAWPNGSELLLNRLVSPLSNWASGTDLYFEVPDGSRTVARGSETSILAVPKRRSGAEVGPLAETTAVLITDGGRRDKLSMGWDADQQAFVVTTAALTESLTYTIVGGGASSEEFRLNVVEAPVIQTAELTAVPPAYTGRPVTELDGIVGDISVFEGSQCLIRLTFNKPVDTAALHWVNRDPRPDPQTEFNREFDHVFESPDDEPSIDNDTAADVPAEDADDVNAEIDRQTEFSEQIPDAQPLDAEPIILGQLSQDGTEAVFEFTADTGGEFRFEITDSHALTNPTEPYRRLEVEYDLPPELTVDGLQQVNELRPGDVVPLNCSVTDDIGVGELDVYLFRDNDVPRIIAADTLARGARSVQHEFRIDVAALGFEQGDTFRIRVRTADERPDPEPHVVWSGDFSVRLSDDAAAIGRQALEESTQQLVDALREMSRELEEDQKTAEQLRDQAWRDWNEASVGETEQLSEKEQQQGLRLKELAAETASHPLMQQQAEALRETAEQLRTTVPEQLAEAADSERRQAAEKLQDTAAELNQARRDLNEAIGQIEEIARVEQELAELNRLALEAEQVAQNAEQLNRDRELSEEDRPQQVSQEEWQQQLNDREQQLQNRGRQLSDDLSEMVRRNPELAEAARRAEQEKAAGLAEDIRELAQTQQMLAEGVSDEAIQAARDTRPLTQRLQEAVNEAERIGREAERAGIDAPRDNLTPLNEASRSLREGNLSDAQRQVGDAEQNQAETSRSLEQASREDNVSEEEQQNRRTLGEQSRELQNELEQIRAEINSARAQRNADAGSQDENPAERPSDAQQQGNQQQGNQQQGNQQQGRPNDQDGEPNAQDRAAEAAQATQAFNERISRLADAAESVGEQLNEAGAPTQNAARESDRAAEQAREAARQARAGRYSKAAEQLRNASNSADGAASRLNEPQQQDQRRELEAIRDETSQLAQSAQAMQNNDAARISSQQQTQQQIAERAADLPAELAELADRMNLPALGMQRESARGQEAGNAAGEAARSADAASDGLQEGAFSESAEQGRNAAAALNRAGQLASQMGEQQADQSALVPSQIGENVTDAMQNLAEAAQSMQQQSEGQQGPSDDGNTESGNNSPNSQSSAAGESSPQGQQSPGQGQPSDGGQTGESFDGGQQGADQSSQNSGGQSSQGQGSPGQSLSEAAQALADAAAGALPKQFRAGQLSSEAGQGGRDGTGNSQQWDGRIPGLTTNADDSAERDWSRLNEELESEVLSGSAESFDREYEALIRLYFRELAKRSAATKSID